MPNSALVPRTEGERRDHEQALSTVGVFALATLSAGTAFARSAEIYTGTFSSLAVGGYDAVAYFKAGKPVEGKAEFATEFKGATWRFASKDDLDVFKANPTAYAPQFGGYCAWARCYSPQT